MLLISISAFVMFLCAEVSAMWYGGNEHTRHPMCSSPNQPCRLQVIMTGADGFEHETIGTGTCTCNPPNDCPTDWTDRRYVVSRRLVSTTHNMTLKMMFCRPVEPKRFCRPGNVSLVVKGSLALPIDISSYNCRCRRRQPLILRERSFGEDNLYYHAYICGNHVDTCERTVPCMSMHQTSTDYNCQCPSGFQCRIPEELWGTESSYGFCSP